jgi:glutamine synthetase
MGDNMQYYKYILRNVAKRHNKLVAQNKAKTVKLLSRNE